MPREFEIQLAAYHRHRLQLVLAARIKPRAYRLRARRVNVYHRPRSRCRRPALNHLASAWRLKESLPSLLRDSRNSEQQRVSFFHVRRIALSEHLHQALLYTSLCLRPTMDEKAATKATWLYFNLGRDCARLLAPDVRFNQGIWRLSWPDYLNELCRGRARESEITWREAGLLAETLPWTIYYRQLMRRQRWRRTFRLVVVFLVMFGALGLFGWWEMQNSRIQSRYLSAWAAEMNYTVEPEASPTIRFPHYGPYDIRLGYTAIPDYTTTLTQRGFLIERQARQSTALREATDLGIFPPYKEKSQAGLHILDHRNRTLYRHLTPERVFPSLDAVPVVVLNTLLFIENREWMSPPTPHHNPAIEWDRFARALVDKGIQMVHKGHQVPGGSTLATQIAKFRHSPEGRTSQAREKLLQMASASLSSYADGPNTTQARSRIALDYLNSVPLSAAPGFGEVFSLGDGLFAWYGSDFEEAMSLLRMPFGKLSPENKRAYAEHYKRVLGLFIAQRRPTYYLAADPEALDQKCNIYLNLLEEHGTISPALREEARKVSLRLRDTPFHPQKPSFLKMKAAQAVRTRMLSLMNVQSLYQLDRLDLTVESTMDGEVQKGVDTLFAQLSDPEFLAANGLNVRHLLAKGNPKDVIYSFTLYEKTDRGNVLRVQTDTLDLPFIYSEGVKLDLGSTAKLRTLLTYLDIIAGLHERYSKLSEEGRLEERQLATDRLSQWTLDFLIDSPEATLEEILAAALERKYSASPGEAFFTGGGLHTFNNFDKKDNGRNPSIKDALKDSINLSFIRLMRDIVNFHIAQITERATAIDKLDPEERRNYLTRFADLEGTSFLRNFYRKYRDKTEDERETLLMQSIRPLPSRVATALLSIDPEMQLAEFAIKMERYCPQLAHSNPLPETPAENEEVDVVVEEGMVLLEDGDIASERENGYASYYEQFKPEKWSLQDRGYLARCHPLELWLVDYLHRHPKADFKEVQKASYEARQEVYAWLFRSSRRAAQNKRIRTMLEMEAFVHIQEQWHSVGYPFEALTPSYATSIGSSGDRPSALCDLMGIILNDGVRSTPFRVERMRFAEGTPYETVFNRSQMPGVQVLHPEVARAARTALAGVVANGTATRVRNAFKNEAGETLQVVGKTGTGDHRRETYGAGGRLISSEAVNRTATFAFIIDNRLYGVITAHVQGPEAADFEFTSMLPLSIMKLMAPALQPLVSPPKPAPPPAPVVTPVAETPAPQAPAPQTTALQGTTANATSATKPAPAQAPKPAATEAVEGERTETTDNVDLDVPILDAPDDEAEDPTAVEPP